MKKFYLVSLLVMVVCMGMYADSTEDAQFKQYVKLTRNHKNNPEGMTVYADYTYRIMYVAMPIAINYSDVTPQVLKAMKSEMLKGIAKEKADCKIIKDLKISIVYTFITSDKRIFTVSFSHKDL